MEYGSQQELYMKLLPVFMVKQRINSITKYKYIKNEDIWKYLALNKWRYDTDLTISEIVNDIIDIDIEKIIKS